MNDAEPEFDYELARAIQLSLEMENAFGIDHLPRGDRLEMEAIAAAPTPAASHRAPVSSENPVSEQEKAAAPASISVGSSAAPEKVLAALNDDIAACVACEFSQSRAQVVPGQGNPQARLFFIGEAPGADEDLSGQAFDGQAGQLLTKMIGAMGLSRDDVFVANILKCRPPEDRNPGKEETQACSHFLQKQLEVIAPEVICTLGPQALNHLLGRVEPIEPIRGQVLKFKGAQLVPTYHPAYLLTEPSAKRAAWQDLQLVMSLLGLPSGQ